MLAGSGFLHVGGSKRRANPSSKLGASLPWPPVVGTTVAAGNQNPLRPGAGSNGIRIDNPVDSPLVDR